MLVRYDLVTVLLLHVHVTVGVGVALNGMSMWNVVPARIVIVRWKRASRWNFGLTVG